MTKTLFFNILMVLAGNYPQKVLNGEYCDYGNYHSICYTFYETGRFEMSHWDCTDLRLGIGRYTLSKKEITLHFEKDTLHKDNSNFTVNYIPTMADSVEISIESFDLNGNPIAPFSLIRVLDKNRNVIFWESSDIDGKLKFKLAKSSGHIEIQNTPAFYQEFETSVDLSKNSEIKFYLDKKRTLIEDSTRVLKYRKITGNEIVLKSGARFSKI